MDINIIKISVLKRSYGTDLVNLLIKDLPDPFGHENHLTIRFDCPKNTAEEYIKDHFNVDPEVIGPF